MFDPLKTYAPLGSQSILARRGYSDLSSVVVNLALNFEDFISKRFRPLLSSTIACLLTSFYTFHFVDDMIISSQKHIQHTIQHLCGVL